MLPQKNISNIFLSLLRKGGEGIFAETAGRLSDEEWEVLYQFGLQTGLLPTFYKRLCDLKLENIPPVFFSKFKNRYLLNLKRNIQLEQELFKILGHLNASGIRAIPLKGPVLARLLYGDIALRPSGCDLDILLRHEKIEEAEKILREMGYLFNQRGQTADFCHKFREQITLHKNTPEQDSVFLDLHWGLRDRFTPTHLNELWEDAREIDLDGLRILVPSNEDLLLYLVLVTVSDLDFVQIKYLYDLYVLISNFAADIDWDSAASKAKKCGLATAFFFALKSSHEVFDTHIPPAVFNSLRPNFIKEHFLKLWMNKRNVLPARNRVALTLVWRHVISSYILSKNIIAGSQVISKKVFLPMDEVMGRYNQPLSKRSYFLYAKRLFRPFIGF